MKKAKLMMLIGTTAALLGVTCEAGSAYRFYKDLVKHEQIAKVREYYTEDLTYGILANRGDDIIIEKIIGTVINNRKDGKIMGQDEYNYISYKDVKGARKGDTILTICIYTPGNNYEDDIADRFDYIIDKGR